MVNQTTERDCSFIEKYATAHRRLLCYERSQPGRTNLYSKPLLFAGLTVVALAFVAVQMGSPMAKAATVHVSDTRYVGAKTCGACHQKQYQVWSKTAHARSLKALVGKQAQDPKCLQCHTTSPGDSSPELMGVQCEACHGAGRYYSPSYIMRDAELRGYLGFKQPGEASCARCHTESTPSMKPFSFKEKFELIRH